MSHRGRLRVSEVLAAGQTAQGTGAVIALSNVLVFAVAGYIEALCIRNRSVSSLAPNRPASSV